MLITINWDPWFTLEYSHSPIPIVSYILGLEFKLKFISDTHREHSPLTGAAGRWWALNLLKITTSVNKFVYIVNTPTSDHFPVSEQRYQACDSFRK